MRYRYKLTLEYDGTNTVGWQKQSVGTSIQGQLETAISNFCGHLVSVTGSGRTDAGVHAKGQIAHIDLHKLYDTYNITEGINFHLRDLYNNIVVISTELVNQQFHARFSAIERHYRYIILNRHSPSALYRNHAWHIRKKIDIQHMIDASQYLLGTHDFTSFRAADCQVKRCIITLHDIDIKAANENIITIDIKARSFLYHMVRNIVGTLYKLNYHNSDPRDMLYILQAKDRKRGGATAPAHGLFLIQVRY